MPEGAVRVTYGRKHNICILIYRFILQCCTSINIVRIMHFVCSFGAKQMKRTKNKKRRKIPHVFGRSSGKYALCPHTAMTSSVSGIHNEFLSCRNRYDRIRPKREREREWRVEKAYSHPFRPKLRNI